MKTIQFGEWPADIHLDFEQVKRIQSGLKIGDQDVASVDLSAGTIRIQGSAPEPYETSLSSCDCEDFARRELPCKHIYALAERMGLLKWDAPKRSGKEAKEAFSSDMEKYRTMYADGQLVPDSYVKICSVLAKSK